MTEQKLINKRILGCWFAMVIVLVGCYILEIVKGNRDVGYVALFSVVAIIPAVIAWVIYSQHKDAYSIRWFCMIGFSITYAFVLFTGSTVVVFVYAWLLLIAFTMTCDLKTVIVYGSITVVLNIAATAYDVIVNKEAAVDTASREIQILATIVAVIYCYISTKTTSTIHEAKMERIQEAENQ